MIDPNEVFVGIRPTAEACMDCTLAYKNGSRYPYCGYYLEKNETAKPRQVSYAGACCPYKIPGAPVYSD